ncbi:MAG: hypothetical protein JWN72_2340, partial [Thermoleophilia bacterium]|nr:hypothetical protein [Thermoleophilia bacterium]
MTTTGPHTQELPGGAELDAALRALVDGPVEFGAPFDGLVDRSRVTNRVRLRMHVADGGRPRWRARVLVVALVAIAVLGAVALVPALRPGSDGSRSLTATADAAETFAWAGDAIVADGTSGTGTGPVWHSVTEQYNAGVLRSVDERWVDTASDHTERTRFSVIPGDHTFEAGLIVRSDGTTNQLRQLNRTERTVTWKPMEGSNANSTHDLEPENGTILGPDGKFAYVGATVNRDEATVRWIRAVSSETSEAKLVRATRIFLRTTRAEFGTDPIDSDPRVLQATTVRQVIHLLGAAQVTPEATRVLYAQVAHVEGLRRLPDARLDGRDVVRIQFDLLAPRNDAIDLSTGQPVPPPSPAVLAQQELILVLDAETGRPLRTTNAAGTYYTTIQPATRVAGVGDGRVTCTSRLTSVPCDLFDPTSALGRLAEAQAESPQMRETARHSRGALDLQPYPLDSDGLPLDDEPKQGYFVGSPRF